MTDLQKLQEALDEWREHPITSRLNKVMGELVRDRKQHFSERWLAGNSPSEPERLALLLLEEWLDNLFNVSAEGLVETEEDLRK